MTSRAIDNALLNPIWLQDNNDYNVDFATGHPGLIENFNTFEAREAAFSRSVGHLVPVRHQGPAVFWRDFSRIIHARAATRKELPAFITSNPRDGLAFGSALQVLTAAAATAHGKAYYDDGEIDHIVRQFSLEAVLDQPIRTLSGGETVRLALAKALVAATCHEQLVIASPFCWMAAAHMPLLDAVVEAYSRTGKRVRILTMHDEASPAPLSVSELDRLEPVSLNFTLICRGCRIALGAPVNAVTTQQHFARIEDTSLAVHSPCLVTGDNGQGKSLLAKALSGAMAIEGTAAVIDAPHQGRPRLLFQDVITQTLMRSTAGILGENEDRPAAETATLFHDLLQQYAHFHAGKTPATTQDCMPRIKAALIAARLADRPAALILDEPDWGLSRAAAIALVLSVVKLAHARAVPVIIISHKPWWPPLAASAVAVSRGNTQGAGQAFTIRLAQLKPQP